MSDVKKNQAYSMAMEAKIHADDGRSEMWEAGMGRTPCHYAKDL
jgi:hypothetical protein